MEHPTEICSFLTERTTSSRRRVWYDHLKTSLNMSSIIRSQISTTCLKRFVSQDPARLMSQSVKQWIELKRVTEISFSFSENTKLLFNNYYCCSEDIPMILWLRKHFVHCSTQAVSVLPIKAEGNKTSPPTICSAFIVRHLSFHGYFDIVLLLIHQFFIRFPWFLINRSSVKRSGEEAG